MIKFRRFSHAPARPAAARMASTAAAAAALFLLLLSPSRFFAVAFFSGTGGAAAAPPMPPVLLPLRPARKSKSSPSSVVAGAGMISAPGIFGIGIPRGGALSLPSRKSSSDDGGENGGSENDGGFGKEDDSAGGGGMLRRKLIQGALGAVVALPVAAEAYSRRIYDLRSGRGIRSGSDLIAPERGGWDDVRHATVVFHGAGGQDQYTDELMDVLRKRVGKNDGSTYEIMIDWSDDSSNLLQASFNGQRVGRKVGSTLLSRAKNLRTVHAVGISVGAFAADSCVTEMKDRIRRAAAKRRSIGGGGSSSDEEEEAPDDVYAQLTLLDPFLQRGAIDPGYGEKNFGRSADYAQQFYNTDDPVPATGKPCRRWCVCTDVTPIRPPSIFGHDWPLVHYARSGNKVGLVERDDQSPAGSIFVATD